MISENTVSVTMGLATKYADKSIELTPLDQTPLHSLCRLSCNMNVKVDGAPLDTSTSIGDISKNSQETSVFGYSLHDAECNEIASVLEKTINFNMDLSKNVVNPIWKSVVEKMSDLLNIRDDVSASRLGVKMDIVEPIFKSSYLASLIEKYDGTPIESHKLSLKVPAPDNIFELIRTGSSSFDKEINEFISVEPDLINRVYNDVFANGGDADINNLLNPYTCDRRYILLTHLIARGLIDNPPDGVNTPLNNYNLYMTLMVSQTGRMLCRVIKNLEDDFKEKRLVLSYPLKDKLGINDQFIRVNSEVYTRWLDEGGSPEILFGAFTTDGEKAYGELLNKRDYYLTSWQRQERIIAESTNATRLNNASLSLSRVMRDEIKSLKDDDKIVPDLNYIALLDKNIANLPHNWYKDSASLLKWTRTIVCDTLFPHTDAKIILEKLDCLTQQYPDLDTRECAYLAFVDYCSLWVGKLITAKQL